jgi:predicted N-acetyltransferase YhbS
MAMLPRHLGDELVLREATVADVEQLVELNGTMHAEPDATEPDRAIEEWTHELFEQPHPTFRPDLALVVEDTAAGRIVSTVLDIPQTWTYAGTPFSVGRPELVATLPEYRRRGLVRAQFEVVHERGDAAGQLLQFITGIPWYYRQFGYEYALDLPAQPAARITKPLTTSGDVKLRPAQLDDGPLLARIDAMVAAASTDLRCLRDEAGWRAELSRRPGGNPATEILVVEDVGAAPEPIGFVVVQKRPWGGQLPVRAFELLPGRSWLEPSAAMLAAVEERRRALAADAVDHLPSGITLALPSAHRALQCLRTHVTPPIGTPYGLYVRVADFPAFLRAVAPVLSGRLAASPVTGYQGRLRIDCYTEGLELVFEDGRLTSVAPWRPADDLDQADASMTRETLMHLVLGNRSLSALESWHADCSVETDVAGALLPVLFPTMPLAMWWLG